MAASSGPSGAAQAGHYPSIGSIVSKMCGARQPGMPPYVAVPYAMAIGNRPGYFSANYLGRQYEPFETEGDPHDRFKAAVGSADR